VTDGRTDRQTLHRPLLRGKNVTNKMCGKTAINTPLKNNRAINATKEINRLMVLLTSSFAVAERPRDAMCPSVVNFNRAKSFIIVIYASDLPLCITDFCSVVLA